MLQFFTDFMNDKDTFLCTIAFGVMALCFIGIGIAIWHYNKDTKRGEDIMKYNGSH